MNDTNNITGFKNTRVDELLRRVRPRVRPAEARRDHPGDRRHPRQPPSLHPRVGRAVPADRVLEQVRPAGGLLSRASATTATSRRCGGSIRRRSSELRRAHGDDSVDQAARSARRKFATGRSTRSTARAAAAEPLEVTAYFLRRLLLIIPTFLGITLAVFVVMHFVPGGPVERADHALPDGGDDRGRRRRRRSAASASRCPRTRSRRSGGTTASTSPCTSATRSGSGTCCISISATRTSTRIRSGTSSSRGFPSRSSSA